MEDVLEVSTRPYDPQRPQVCLDETSRQLLAEVSPPRPVALAGRPARIMSTSAVACATCFWSVSRLLAGATSWSARGAPASTGRTASRTCWRFTTPTPSGSCWCKTTPNTHTPASLYEAFAPAEARRLADRATLEREVAAWQAARNRAGRGVDWRFTTEGARIKLKHLYPVIQA